MTSVVELAWTVPANWSLVPPLDGDDHAEWIAELASRGQTGAGAGRALDADLEQLHRLMSVGTPELQWFVVLPEDAIAPRFRAAGWIRQSPIGDGDAPDVRRTIFERSEHIGARVLSDEVVEFDAGRQEILRHQFLSADDEHGVPHIVERLALLLIDPGRQHAVELEVTTSDMAAFEDVVSTGTALLSSMRLRAEGTE